MAFMNNLQPLAYPYNLSGHNFTKDNCTGKTTAVCLRAISDAMLSPNTSIDLQKLRELDNSHKASLNTAGGFLDCLQEVIDKMELKFLNLNRTRATLTYNIY